MTNALFRLAFAKGSRYNSLTNAIPSKSPAHSSTGTRSIFINLPLLVSLRFHVLFHSPTGVLFTFLSRYYCTIGHSVIFSLTRWSSLIHTEFHVFHATRDKTFLFYVTTTRLSLSMVQDSAASLYLDKSIFFVFPLHPFYYK
jgi:hypothetical protein